jgi:DNA-directed RNA polymerase subunit RPC12/RpoP
MGLKQRLEKLTQRYRPTCLECGGLAPIVIVDDIHPTEVPAPCPECGSRPLVIEAVRPEG